MTGADQAREHRNRVNRPVFIGITGSCGKTTTRDLAAHLLRPNLRGVVSADDGNCGAKLIANVLCVTQDDDFCIQEFGAWAAGTLDPALEIVRPKLGVVLNIRNDHYSSFRGLENASLEKAKVVSCLPSSGTAILNADDPYVWKMRDVTDASVLSFGSGEEADFRYGDVQSAWPNRLSFTVTYREESHRVQTNLIGEHLVDSAVAALAIAVAMGISFPTAVCRLAEARPTPRRMSPVFLDSGITFIRDDFKATFDSMLEIVKFLAKADVPRKVAVLGRISDHPGRSRHAFTTFAKAVAEVVDLLILVGQRSEDLWGRHRRDTDNFLCEFRDANATVQLFETVLSAAVHLRGELRSGDFVLLKGSGVSDHLERILLQYQKPVRCWQAHCGKVVDCDICEMLSLASEPSS